MFESFKTAFKALEWVFPTCIFAAVILGLLESFGYISFTTLVVLAILMGFATALWWWAFHADDDL